MTTHTNEPDQRPAPDAAEMTHSAGDIEVSDAMLDAGLLELMGHEITGKGDPASWREAVGEVFRAMHQAQLLEKSNCTSY